MKKSAGGPTPRRSTKRCQTYGQKWRAPVIFYHLVHIYLETIDLYEKKTLGAPNISDDW